LNSFIINLFVLIYKKNIVKQTILSRKTSLNIRSG
jgi:hypothetical protein